MRFDGQVATWFIGWALTAFVLLGSVALIVQAVGDSWAEVCIAEGGEYIHDQQPSPANPDIWLDDERCELP